MQVNKCPITCKEGFETYSLQGVKQVFDNKRVSHILPFSKAALTDDFLVEKNEVLQYKIYSVGRNKKKKLQLAQEQAMFELLVCNNSEDAKKLIDNFFITTYIARTIFGLPIAPASIIYFANGEPCFIYQSQKTNRDGEKIWHKTSQEICEEKNITSSVSYKTIGELIDEYCPTALIQKELFFKRLIFNYLFSVGSVDAKQVSFKDVLNNDDVILSAATQLCNTRMYLQDNDMALQLSDTNNDEIVRHETFMDFAKQIGLHQLRAERTLQKMTSMSDKVRKLISSSELTSDMQVKYYGLYNNRASRLKKK
jgi:serine/threonine-protein kinase HipA